MSEESYQLENLRFLIIDDHDPMRKAVRKILQDMGVQRIDESFDGSSAIAHLQKNRVDFILCDIYMRNTDGFEVLQFVRNRSIASDIPFLMVSGEGSKEDIVKTSDLGADGYLIKPFQAEQFIEKVKGILKGFYNPSPFLKLVREGDSRIQERDYYGAKDCFAKAKEMDPDSARAKHSYAVATHYCGETAQAIQLLRDNIKESETYYRNFATLANLLLQADDTRGAIAAMRRELDLNPKQPNRQSHLGKLLLELGDAKGAIEHFRNALISNKKHRGALMGMAQAYTRQEDLEKALYYFKRIRRYHPEDKKSLHAAVHSCLKLNQPRRAELFLKDEKNNPNSKSMIGYILLAKFYLSQDRKEEGEKVLEELFKKQPEHPEGLTIRAKLEIQQKRYDKATFYLEKIVDNHPTMENLLALADCLNHQKKFGSAITTLHKAKNLEPNNHMVLFLLGQAYKTSKQFSKAYHCFWQLCQLNYRRSESESLLLACHQATLRRRGQKIRQAM